MARKLSVDIPQLAVPEPIIDMIERDRMAGVEIACDLIGKIYESRAPDVGGKSMQGQVCLTE
jgi:hypothetical protein